MGKIVVHRDQQTETRRRYPLPAYSRVVLIELLVKGAGGDQDWAATRALGNRIWLMGVDVWFMPITVGALIETFVYLRTGPKGSINAGIIGQKWASIFDDRMLLKKAIWYQGAAGHMHFNCMQLYLDFDRRFGCTMTKTVGSADFWALVGFQISEG